MFLLGSETPRSRADVIFIACCVHLNIIKQEISCTVGLVTEAEYQQREEEEEEEKGAQLF